MNNSKTILIIDDSKSILKFLRNLLEAEGYTIYTANNGFKGVVSFEYHKPDLVLTDIIMPDMDGLEVILKLKKDHPNCKIMAMSAGGSIASKDYLNQAKIFGACSLLKKPLDLHLLKKEIHKNIQ